MRSDILRKIMQARTFECLPKDKAGGMLVHLPKNCRISESSVRRSIRPVYPVACTVLSDGAHCRILCPLHPIRHQNRCVVYSPYTVVPFRLLRVKTDITATSEVLGCSSAELILNYVVKTTEFGGRNANRTRPAAVFTAARRAVMLCRALCRHARRGIKFRWKNNVK